MAQTGYDGYLNVFIQHLSLDLDHDLHLLNTATEVEISMDTSRNDAEIAEQIRIKLGQSPDIERVAVKDHLLQVHVTEPLFRRLSLDRERGRKIVLTLMQNMKTLTGLTDVTVRIYCQNEKVIEGKVKDWGGDNVQYMYDL